MSVIKFLQEKLLINLAASFACHAAVKAGDSLSIEELDKRFERI
tara:strand:+ start:1048 stop:1179 length:132 start_codon:yes stop_codon:yes gene_type:complete